MKNKEKLVKQWKAIKILAVVLMLLAIVVGSQRVDIGETSTTYSEMGEYSSQFYNTTGNDSVFYFDSDQYSTHVLTLDGTSGNVTINKGNLTINENLTISNWQIYVDGNGTLVWEMKP